MIFKVPQPTASQIIPQMMKTSQYRTWLLGLLLLWGGLFWQTELLANSIKPTRPAAIFVKTTSCTKVAMINETSEKVQRLVSAANQIIGGASQAATNAEIFLPLGARAKVIGSPFYVSRTHLFMNVFGITFDVGSNGKKTGPRWLPDGCRTKGFQPKPLNGI